MTITAKTSDIKSRLETIWMYEKGLDHQVREFCSHLASHFVSPDITPLIFVMKYERSINDVIDAYDGNYQGKPLPRSLDRGMQTIDAYLSFRPYLPKIAKATCPEDFANEVISLYKEALNSK